MKVTISDGPIRLTLEDGLRPSVSVHVTDESVAIVANYWPPDKHKGAAYIALTVKTDPRDEAWQAEAYTYLNLEQAETMRDALTAALREAMKERISAASASAEGSEAAS